MSIIMTNEHQHQQHHCNSMVFIIFLSIMSIIMYHEHHHHQWTLGQSRFDAWHGAKFRITAATKFTSKLPKWAPGHGQQLGSQMSNRCNSGL